MHDELNVPAVFFDHRNKNNSVNINCELVIRHAEVRDGKGCIV